MTLQTKLGKAAVHNAPTGRHPARAAYRHPGRLLPRGAARYGYLDLLTPLVGQEHPRGLRGDAAPRRVMGGPMFRTMAATAGASVALAAVAPTPATAAPEPKRVALKSNGLGVCVSQLAIMPELIGVERLGQEVSDLARTKMLLEAMEDVRSPECGYPPGPGHLR